MKRKRHYFIKYTTVITAAAFAALRLAAKSQKPDSIFDDEITQKNPLEGKKVIFVEDENDNENADGARGHLEAVGETEPSESFYQKYVKRGVDVLLSFGGLVILAPVLGTISLAIKIDDPGPVLFTQKRIGQDKQFFKLHKFRSMKMSTPHDVPTHMLDNPDQYITKTGKFLRAHSLDELPQIWDIFIGNMSVIGPRPALWNQDVLTAERDKYGANDIKPGLTGWAQINGRDELELPEKARLDGEYAEKLSEGGFKALLFDCKCFIDTIFSVARSEGVVEGGTGAVHNLLRAGVPDEDPDTPLGCDIDLTVDLKTEKKVLITGAGSYIGESVKAYAASKYPNIKVDTIDMIDGTWRSFDFSKYDCVYHVAGIAHSDTGNVSDEVKEKYYKVNTDLALEVAKKAKTEGVKQFIFMSSMIVYGDSAPYGTEKMIERATTPKPDNFYGDSKWQADKGIRALADGTFRTAILRPPMIYGKGSKGNYPVLAKIARKFPAFPDADNRRSMLHIDNLCEFVCKLIMCGEGGIYFPQNDEYTKTSKMVKGIAKAANRRIIVTKALDPAVTLASHMPGRIGEMVNKAFGNNCYSQDLSRYSFEYVVNSLNKSIQLTEGVTYGTDDNHKVCIVNCFDTYEQRVDLLFEYFKNRGYETEVLTSDYRHFEKTVRTEPKEGFTFIKAIPYEKNLSVTRLRSHYSLAKAIKKELEKRKPALIWVLVPPNSFVKEVGGYKKEYPNAKVVFDLIDLWPETMPLPLPASLPPLAYWRNLRNNNLRHADAIVTECNLYVEKLPAEIASKAKTIYLARDIKRMPEQQPDIPQDRIALCYLGSINNIIDIDTICRLIKGISCIRAVDLHVIGDGENRAEMIQSCSDAGAKVIYHGKVYNEDEKQKIFASCHYGLNIMKESVYIGLTMKSIDYFEAGLPLINNIHGDTWDIISKNDTGYNFDGSDEIFEKICDYHEEMRKHTRELFEKEFGREAFEKRVDSVIEELK